AIFEQILRDEKYHVAYTKTFLTQVRRSGRSTEVRRALRSARSSRLMTAWRQVGIRSGAASSRVLLLVLYWTIVPPFALLARLRRRVEDPRPSPEAMRASTLDSQY